MAPNRVAPSRVGNWGREELEDAVEGGRLLCDGLARFDGVSLDHFVPGRCITMDIAADSSVWVLAGEDIYVITPSSPGCRRPGPLYLGYNRVSARVEADLVVAVGDDPLAVAGQVRPWSLGRLHLGPRPALGARHHSSAGTGMRPCGTTSSCWVAWKLTAHADDL